MNAINHPVSSAEDVLMMLEQENLPAIRRRDLVSGVSRICIMLGCQPAALKLDVPLLRAKLAGIRPAAHGITRKTYGNLRSLFVAALDAAGIIDGLGRGGAKRDSNWRGIVNAVSGDKRLSNGLAAFMNWCARQGIKPDEVSNDTVRLFSVWLDRRTLHPKPRDLVRGVPRIWNEARQAIPGWPAQELQCISYKVASENLDWSDLPDGFRGQADAYLKLRAEPDLFDTDPGIPQRPLAATTVRQQREHIRLAASVLVRAGAPVAALASLEALVQPEAFKTVLRHYHNAAGGKPNAFVVGLSKTLIDVARYHARLDHLALQALKATAAKLPPVPYELTEKNKELLRLLENEGTRARLLFMADMLMRKAEAELQRGRGRMPFVLAQVAIAVDILLVAPLRPENLSELNWTRHFKEPQGPKGKLLLHIPKLETKSKRRELTFEIPEEVARKIRWYRREIMPRLGADPVGDLFVSQRRGCRKTQETLTTQIVAAIADHVGIHMTPQQFRHVAAALYLDEHPEDFQTVTDLLGHAWAKTTLIYAGSSSRRASKAYGGMLVAKREAMKLKRGSKQRRAR